MTKTQIAAILEVAENGERFAPHNLNISARTVRSLAVRGWVSIENGAAIVTAAGWAALEAA